MELLEGCNLSLNVGPSGCAKSRCDWDACRVIIVLNVTVLGNCQPIGSENPTRVGGGKDGAAPRGEHWHHTIIDSCRVA